MLTLLRDLRTLRKTLDLAGPRRASSVAIRHVDAGSCNGCEHELTLLWSPYYDLQRFGLGIVASPRHADVLLVTGPVTSRMREPLRVAYEAMPEPRRVAALGDCARAPGTHRRSLATGAIRLADPIRHTTLRGASLCLSRTRGA